MEEIYGVDPETGFIVVETEEDDYEVFETGAQEVDVQVPESEETLPYGDPPDIMWPESLLESALEEPPASVVAYTAPSASASADGDPVPLASDTAYDLDGMVVYELEVSSYGHCWAVFTPEQAERVTVEAGQIVNWSSSDVRVPLYVSEPADRPAQSTLSLVILGRGASGFASNVYRYGQSQYVVSYYVSGSSLSSTNTYVAVSEAEQTSYSRSYWLWVVVIVCLLVMAVNGLIRFLRRGHRG